MIRFHYNGKSVSIDPDNIYYKKDIKKVWNGWYSGLYFIFDKNNALLYVGWATYLPDRIKQHFRGNSKNTRNFLDEMERAETIDAKRFNDIQAEIKNKLGITFEDFEGFFIEVMKPKYNRRRVRANVSLLK